LSITLWLVSPVMSQQAWAEGLIASTFLGGLGSDGIGVELAVDVAVDRDGNVIVAATTSSADLRALPGCYTSGPGGGTDVLLAKLNPELSELLGLAVVGGSADETGVALAIGSDGRVSFVTTTFSADYPTTPGAYSGSRSGAADCAVSVLSSGLTELVASSYFGGSGMEAGPDIAVDTSNQVFLCGMVGSAGIPTTPGAFSRSFGGGSDFFVSRLSADLSTLLASTYLGGRYADEMPTIAVAESGEVAISGRSESDDYPVTSGAFDESFSGPPAPGEYLHDMVVSKLSNDLSTLLASTFAGGAAYDGSMLTAVDPVGNVIVSGHSASPDFPVTDGCFDQVHNGINEMYISKFDSGLATLLASTFLTPLNVGIGESTFGTGLSCDSQGNILYTGVASGTAMPTTGNAYAGEFSGGTTDGMVFFFNPELSELLYGSYLGGTQAEWYVVGSQAPDGNLILAGNTESADFPTSVGACDDSYSGGASDLFITKLGYNCCSGRVGDANGQGDDQPTISDISVIIDAKFITGTCDGVIACFAEADVNQSGGVYPGCGDITISDIATLIDYLFITGPETATLLECL